MPISNYLIIIITTTTISSYRVETCISHNCTIGSQECDHYGYCHPEKGVCCLGPYGQCSSQGSRAIRPLVSCTDDEQCGSNYCDRKMNICCGEGEDGLCPNRVTFYGIEPPCEGGSCREGAFCFRGHCCPENESEGVNVVARRLPYKTNRKCSGNDAPPFRNTFCDRKEQKLAIFGNFQHNGLENDAKELYCITNNNCRDTDICVYKGTIGTCFGDPFADPLEIVFDPSDPMSILLFVLFAFSLLICGVVSVVNSTRRFEYYVF